MKQFINKQLKVPKNIHLNNNLAYLFGAVLGDGCLYIGNYAYQFSITAEDYDFCEMCSNIIWDVFGKRGRIKTIKKNNVISYYQLVVCSKDIVYFFINKTNNKTKIPSFIYYSKKMMKSFMRGLMDSDGWISKVNASDGYIRYRVGFKNISCWTPDFYNIFCKVGIKTGALRRQENERSNKEAYVFTINTNDFCKKVGFDINRKKEIQKEYIDVEKEKNR